MLDLNRRDEQWVNSSPLCSASYYEGGTMRRLQFCSAILGVVIGCPLSADEPVPVLEGAVVKREAIVAFTEGPAWHPDGNVYFSDIVNNRIMRR
ncbi:MAG: hypothetical protein VB875_04705, partial [Pirellulales bacterium]